MKIIANLLVYCTRFRCHIYRLHPNNHTEERKVECKSLRTKFRSNFLAIRI